MPLPEDVISKLNATLGVTGLPHRVFIPGGTGKSAEWIETDCLVWTVPAALPESPPQFSEELQDALDRISAQIEQEHLETMFQGMTKQLVYLARFNTLLAEEPVPLRVEYETHKRYLQRAADGKAGEEDQLLARVREVIKDDPVFAYKIEPDYSLGLSAYRIVVAPTTDQFDILRIEHIEGTNYSLGTEDIIAGLERLDERYGIDIRGAQGWVEFILRRTPEGEEARMVSQWLREFCPDAHYEEYDEDSESLRDNTIVMWWD